jgi:VanZ family protein
VSADLEAPPPADPPAGTLGSAVVRRWWRWGVVVLYAAAIFTMSSMSRVSIPMRLSDKVVHAGVYSLLAAVLMWAVVAGDWRKVRAQHVVAVTVVCMLYGLSDEIHQLFVPRRRYELLDLAADTSGALGAAVAGWAWGIIRRGPAQSKDV